MTCKHERVRNNEPSECRLNGGGDTCNGCEIGEAYEEVEKAKYYCERMTQAVEETTKLLERVRKESLESIDEAIERLRKLLPKKEVIHHEPEGPRAKD